MLALLIPGVGMGGGDGVADVVAPSGGWERLPWGFRTDYEENLRRQRAERATRREREEETESIEDLVTRDIAEIFRAEEEHEARDEELQRIKKFAREYTASTAKRQMGERVAKAYERAARQGNRSALEALEREMARAVEEEDFMTIAMMLVLD